MKKIFLLCISCIAALLSFSQIGYKKNDAYQVTVGTSKNSASFGKNGFTIKGNEIRIVGFLYRGNKIEYDKLFIETKRDGIVVDSLIIPCCGINKKWRDFYVMLSDVKYSDNYAITVYTYNERKYLGSKYFFIRQE